MQDIVWNGPCILAEVGKKSFELQNGGQEMVSILCAKRQSKLWRLRWPGAVRSTWTLRIALAWSFGQVAHNQAGNPITRKPGKQISQEFNVISLRKKLEGRPQRPDSGATALAACPFKQPESRNALSHVCEVLKYTALNTNNEHIAHLPKCARADT